MGPGCPIAKISVARHLAQMEQSNSVARRTRLSTWRGVGIGTLVTGPAILAAIMSGGAGHGSYVTARVLFPFSMLFSQLEGAIGPVAMGVGLLQFPLYGALIGRTFAVKTSRTFLLATAHFVAVLVCFSGLLSALP